MNKMFTSLRLRKKKHFPSPNPSSPVEKNTLVCTMCKISDEHYFAGILRDKTMNNKLVNISNDETKLPFMLIEIIGCKV